MRLLAAGLLTLLAIGGADAASGKRNDAAATPARSSTPAPVWVGKGKPAAPVVPPAADAEEKKV